MANWEKKIKSGGGKDLHPGENLLGGVMLNPSGTTTKMVATGVGGIVGAAIADKMRDGSGRDGGDGEELVSDAGLAAQLPDERIWLGLTPTRLLVWGHSTLSGKPKGLKTTLQRSDLVRVELEKMKATYSATLRFADGTAKVYEAPKMLNDPEGFAAAVAEG